MLFASFLLALAPAADDGQAIQAFAHCAVGADRAGAVALIATAPGSKEADASLRKLAGHDGCKAQLGKGKPDEQLVRGAIATELYLAAYPAAPAPVAGTPAPFQGSGNPALVQYDLGRCAATRDPVAADALVRTAPGSAEERAALGPVVEAVGRCTPSGAKVGFTRVKLRAAVAEGLWAVRSGAAAQ